MTAGEGQGRTEGHAEGVGIFCVGCGTVRAATEPACTCRARSEPIAFEAARLLRALARAREDTLTHLDYWDSITAGPSPTSIKIRELLCLCEPGAPAHEHSTGGYR